MDEDVLSSLNSLKKTNEFAEMFPTYPCTHCTTQSHCCNKNKGCYKWIQWFSEEWGKIRGKFGKENVTPCD